MLDFNTSHQSYAFKYPPPPPGRPHTLPAAAHSNSQTDALKRAWLEGAGYLRCAQNHLNDGQEEYDAAESSGRRKQSVS